MDCRLLELTKEQLVTFKNGLEEGKLWSSIYTFLKEPDVLCGLVGIEEKDGSIEDKDERLFQSVYSTTSMFIAKISVEDKYRAYNIVKLIRTELCEKLSSYNEIFIEFKHSNEALLSRKDIRIIIDPIKHVTEDGTEINWNASTDARHNATTDVYIIGTVKPVKVLKEEEMIDTVLDEINDIDLGEYKDILIKRAEQHAKMTIEDYKENQDIVVVSMADYLAGAAEAIKIMKANNK